MKSSDFPEWDSRGRCTPGFHATGVVPPASWSALWPVAEVPASYPLTLSFRTLACETIRMSRPFDVFRSYARADDEPFVARLYSDLTKRGLTVWWDRQSMPSRALTFLQEIRAAIDSCNRVIAVAGHRAVSSEYVLAEWQCAALFSKAVVPVLRFGDYDLLPPDLRWLHASDFRDDSKYDTALNEVVRILDDPCRTAVRVRTKLMRYGKARPDAGNCHRVKYYRSHSNCVKMH